MSNERFRFIGGPQDGKSLPVPSPISPQMEFLVRPGEPYLPWDSYRLMDDGSFHHVAQGTPVPGDADAARPAAS